MSTGVFVLVFVYFLLNSFHVPRPCEVPVCSDATSNITDVLSADCPTNNNCSLPYYFEDANVCRTLTAPAGTSCQDVCYATDSESTQCDEFGACTGNATECRGYCTLDSQCNTTIPLNDFWLSPEGVWETVQVLWNYVYECQYNRCEFFTLDLYWESEASATGQPISSYGRCVDFLDVAWFNERERCIVVESVLLDTNMTNSYFPGNNPTLPSQFRMCSFHYNCAFNATAYAKRSLLDDSRDDYLQAVAQRLLLR